MRLWALVCALLPVTFAATAAPLDEGHQVSRERESRFIVSVGDPAPTFQIVTNEGDSIDSDLLRGQVVVLLFAASWCPFSQAQLIDYQDIIWDKYKNMANFAMIVLCEDTEEDRPTFLKQRVENDIRMPYGFDSNETIYRLFATPNGSVTRTVVISPDWRIAELHDMHTRKSMRKIRHRVRRLMSEAGQ